jgi:hypothetical protein
VKENDNSSLVKEKGKKKSLQCSGYGSSSVKEKGNKIQFDAVVTTALW